MSKSQKKNEQGRSMVEMLGVLAMMGVLSVAGIAGYNSAMNKHRANELLNEASKRAAIVAAQVLQGRETLSISEFGTENTKLGFSETVAHDKTNAQFTLKIGGIAEAVCQQMKNTKGPIIRKFEPATCVDDATVKLTFNDDMSTTPKASDYATKDACVAGGKNWCESANKCSEGECCATGDCVASSCPAGSSTAGMGGNTGVYVDGTECACNNSGEYYTQNGCEIPTDTCTSWTTNECGKGRYCHFEYDESVNTTSTNWTDRYIKPYYQNLNGYCKDIPASHAIQINDKIVYDYGSKLNWWSGASLCLGAGKKMITAADLGFGKNNDEGQIGEYGTMNSCSGTDCPIICPCGENNTACTSSETGCTEGICDCWSYLKTLFGNQVAYWTAAARGTQVNDYSWLVYHVYMVLDTCRISEAARHTITPRTLCL